MRASDAVILVLAAAGLGCGGLFEDELADGPAAERAWIRMAGSLPPGATDARFVATTGIDWNAAAEVRAPRAAAEAWFAAVSLPCDQPTADGAEGVGWIYDANRTWGAPPGTTWRARHCQDSGYDGPHYEVMLSEEGDPAWLRVTAYTM